MENNTVFVTPKIVPLENIPANNNPYLYDRERMGCSVSGAWEAMYREFGGLKQEHNMSEDEVKRRKKGEQIFYDDPDHIIMINKRTGQRFMIDFSPENVENKLPKVKDTVLCKLTSGTSQPIIRGKKYIVRGVLVDENDNTTLYVNNSWYHISCFDLS